MHTLVARRVVRAAALLPVLSAAALSGAEVQACGGFFCGLQPVDQTAERILFEVGPDTVTMTTQISYSGRAEDFAWILPLSEVPDVQSLSVYPQQALNALDANTGPTFLPPPGLECSRLNAPPSRPSTALPGTAFTPPPVNVFIRAEVGPYDAAVVGSESPTELVAWLRNEGYRITPAMEPYVARYTQEDMKFLALKLLETAEVKDLKPFRFTLPGTAPSIPLRMTALAAEPEMSILVFVLGQQRFEGKNWANVTVADDQIRYNPYSFSFPIQTNWAQLVAKGVDEAGGQGWVTEFAGASQPYLDLVRQQVQNDNFATEENREAARALLTALEANPYLTRLYTRLSAEEMTSDPVFGRSDAGEVGRNHQLSRYVNGEDQCPMDLSASVNPCEFTTCGTAGLCRSVLLEDTGMNGEGLPPLMGGAIAGCACLAGATARMTYAPGGDIAVICQDGRLSFLNPGDREYEAAEALPDPCATFSCGDHGQCASMNLTPTCVCDQGFVAVGRLAADGTRRMNCVEPSEPIPAAFYAGQLPALPEELPGGREVILTTAQPMAASGSRPGPTVGAGFPMPRGNPDLGPSQIPVAVSAAQRSSNDGGCALGGVSSGSSWALLLLAAAAARRRRAHRG